VSLDALSSDSSLMPVLAVWAAMANEQADMPAIKRAEKEEDEAAKRANAPMPVHAYRPNPDSWDPSWLFNAMVAPAIGFRIKGVIWYQGESNSRLDRALIYQRVFSTLIADWRSQWREGEFPFLFTQISSFNPDTPEDWPAIREAQRRTLSVANTAMAVTMDVGDPSNVHPSDKQTVGARLALAARAIAYNEAVEYSGPQYRQASIENGGIRIWFDHTTGGLTARGAAVQGFEIASDDHRFVPASARIDGESVFVSSSEMERPKFVHYGWQNAPSVNLYNSVGLPASPFTSEQEIPPPRQIAAQANSR
jgi:sialate O-acetylesterase